MPDEPVMTETDVEEIEGATPESAEAEVETTEEPTTETTEATKTEEAEEEDADGTSQEEETEEGEEGKAAKEGEEVEYDDDYEIQGTLVVDGKEIDRSVPLKRLWQSYQMEAASQKKFQEASQVHNATQEMLGYFMQNPFNVLREFYTNQFRGDRGRANEYVDSLIDQAGAARLEEASMPEHERRLRDMQRELQQQRIEHERMLNQQEEDKLRAQTESFRQKHDQNIASAIRELTEIKDFNTREAHVLFDAIDRKFWEMKDYGLEPTELDAAEHVLEERRQYLEGYLETVDPDELMKLKPGIEQKVNKRSLEKVKGQQARRMATAPDVPATDRTGKEPAYSTWDDLEKDAGNF